MKQRIRLSESQLRQIVKESVKRILKENEEGYWFSDEPLSANEFQHKFGVKPNFGGDRYPFSHKGSDGVKFYGSESERFIDELYDSAIETIEANGGEVNFDDWFSTYMYDDIDRWEAERIFKKALRDYNGE